jgi:hypothetical protein
LERDYHDQYNQKLHDRDILSWVCGDYGGCHDIIHDWDVSIMAIRLQDISKEIGYVRVDITVKDNYLIIRVPYLDNEFANKVFERINKV